MRIVLMEIYSHTPTPDYGQIASEFRARGHRVWYGALNESGDVDWYDDLRIVKTTRGPRAVPQSLAALPLISHLLQLFVFSAFVWRLKDALSEHRPEVVQVNPAGFFAVCLLPLCMPFSTAFVIDWRQIDKRLKKGVLGRVKHFLRSRFRRAYSKNVFYCATFLSESGARQVMGKHWQKSAAVIPLGVAGHFLSHAARPERIDRPTVHFLYLGAISRIRRLEILFQAAKLVRDATSSFQFDFIGPDTSNGFYDRLASELGIEDSVCVKHAVPYDTVPELVASYDVVIAYVPDFPADWHYHPTLKVVEYRAVGRPIIASDFDPNRQLVVPGQNGLLVKNSADEFAGAMLAFINDRRFLDTCIRNAAGMRTGISWPQVAEMYERDVYSNIIST
jgi:glycosyltransferase involved in cell wall biosynthesis